jgi:LMBR1 domain-containing protein 1
MIVGDKAISFVISIFSVIGMLLLTLYTGYGLGALPFYLIKGKKSLSSAHLEYEMDKAQIREKIRSLQEKQGRKGALNNKEKYELKKLREDEQNLDKKLTRISSLLESDHLLNKLLSILTPFRVVIGFGCLVLSLLIFVALLTTSLDRLLHSKCGLQCGFILDDMNYTNYLDFSLLKASKYFHLDLVLFSIVNIYIYICSIYGFVKLGVKFCLFTVINIFNHYSGSTSENKTQILKDY